MERYGHYVTGMTDHYFRDELSEKAYEICADNATVIAWRMKQYRRYQGERELRLLQETARTAWRYACFTVALTTNY